MGAKTSNFRVGIYFAILLKLVLMTLLLFSSALNQGDIRINQQNKIARKKLSVLSFTFFKNTSQKNVILENF